MTIRGRRGVALVALLSNVACNEKPPAPPPPALPSSVETCDLLVPRWIAHLKATPDVSMPKRNRADLPVASLGGIIGAGSWVEIRGDEIKIDDAPVAGQNQAERLRALEALLISTKEGAGDAGAAEHRKRLYLSVAAATDVRTLRTYLRSIPTTFEVKLVYQMPPSGEARPPSPELERLTTETDSAARQKLARSAYAPATRCESMLDAIARVEATDAPSRWRGLRAALIASLPKCDCRDVDALAMRELLLYERRRGIATLASLPIDFVRDERCGASLELTPLQDLVKDIQTFDEKFSSTQQGDELVFEPVLTTEQLAVYVCRALPGETLAALQREGRTFYWRVPRAPQCQAWQFEPREPGSPMGIWRRRSPESGAPLSIHYVQAAEEVRLSGPVTDDAVMGEEQGWACTQDFRLRGVDEHSIQLDVGRWYFDGEACRRASAEAAEFPGCIAALASKSEPAKP